MFGKIYSILAWIISAFFGGVILKDRIEKTKESNKIKNTLKKYNEIDDNRNSIDGDSLLKNGISSKSPEKVNSEKKSK